MNYLVCDSSYVFRRMDDESYPVGTGNLGWHYHTTYELFYFLRGDIDYQIQQSLYTLQPHSLLIIKPGEYHSMHVKSTKRLDRLMIHFDENSISPKLQESLRSMGSVYLVSGTHLSEELLRLDNYYKDLSSDVHLDVFVSQLQIILEYIRNITGMRLTESYVDHGAEKIISYIQRNLSSIHTLNDICQNVHMSKSTVQNLISGYLQIPVMSYVRTQKCIMARSLLQKGYIPSDVALLCGFNDYSSFYRAFRKVFGTPPSTATTDLGVFRPEDIADLI